MSEQAEHDRERVTRVISSALRSTEPLAFAGMVLDAVLSEPDALKRLLKES